MFGMRGSAPSGLSRPPMVHAADGGDRIRTIDAACATSCRAGSKNPRPEPWMGDGHSVGSVFSVLHALQTALNHRCLQCIKIKVQNATDRVCCAPGAPASTSSTLLRAQGKQPLPRKGRGLRRPWMVQSGSPHRRTRRGFSMARKKAWFVDGRPCYTTRA